MVKTELSVMMDSRGCSVQVPSEVLEVVKISSDWVDLKNETTTAGMSLETALKELHPYYNASEKIEDPAASAPVSSDLFDGKNDSAALLKRYQERKQKLLAIGYPYYSMLKNEDGSFNIPTSDESTYWDYAAGVITFSDAARELCRCGFTNFVDEKYTRAVFAKINERLHKLDDNLKPIKAVA